MIAKLIQASIRHGFKEDWETTTIPDKRFKGGFKLRKRTDVYYTLSLEVETKENLSVGNRIRIDELGGYIVTARNCLYLPCRLTLTSIQSFTKAYDFLVIKSDLNFEYA